MTIYRMCRVFRALPYEGGVLNQPKSAINRLLAIGDAHDRFESESMTDPADRDK